MLPSSKSQVEVLGQDLTRPLLAVRSLACLQGWVGICPGVLFGPRRI